MSQKHFGTDGVRGIANDKLTPEFALNLAAGVAEAASSEKLPKRAYIIRDTRQSGEMLQCAVTAAFLAAGWNVADGGVLPTPAASLAVLHGGYSIGVVVSASHNPAEDNGIKFFGPDGKKLSEKLESSAEAKMEAHEFVRPHGVGLGILQSGSEIREKYYARLHSAAAKCNRRLKIAVDCANGAAFSIAPQLLTQLGHELVLIGCSPSGTNINREGGATKPHIVQSKTVENKCDLGIAFDGDADRCVFSDEKGRLINGDKFLAAYAYLMEKRGMKARSVVGTVMSNGGLREHLGREGVELIQAPVGDKYVQKEIESSGSPVGGEQSGHIIIPHYGPTGDGLMTAVEFLNVLEETGLKASEIHDLYSSWPQVLFNLKVGKPKEWDLNQSATEIVNESQAILGDGGRINVRPSGTQPVLRLMIEAKDEAKRNEVAEKVLAVFERELGCQVGSQVDLTHALGD